ncbi:MAG: PadR family transcriptional regulator PadR [Saprospiraceae bacterium]
MTKIIVMGRSYLSEFEELILTIVGILGEETYGNAIVEEIWNQISRKVNLNTVHITLYRLEDRGLVKSHYGGATALRGGRRKRLFDITNAGLNTIKIQQEQRNKLWNLIPGLKMIAT